MGLFHKLDIFVHKFCEQCSSMVLIHPTCPLTLKKLQEHHNFWVVLADKIQFLVHGESEMIQLKENCLLLNINRKIKPQKIGQQKS